MKKLLIMTFLLLSFISVADQGEVLSEIDCNAQAFDVSTDSSVQGHLIDKDVTTLTVDN